MVSTDSSEFMPQSRRSASFPSANRNTLTRPSSKGIGSRSSKTPSTTSIRPPSVNIPPLSADNYQSRHHCRWPGRTQGREGGGDQVPIPFQETYLESTFSLDRELPCLQARGHRSLEVQVTRASLRSHAPVSRPGAQLQDHDVEWRQRDPATVR